ncbi:MAG TPA: hypothetical protein VHL10_05785 [Nitrososphaera sp.]|nr:hypothetical protein [Nitrososphaera sp.]
MSRTKSQQMMVEDGLPAELLATQDERAADWVANPPKPPTSTMMFKEPATSEDQATLQLLAEMAVKKKVKASNRNSKMLSKKEDHTNERWDTRKGKWVPLNQGANKMISITTNTRGATQMPAKKDYAEMSGPELVAAYNKVSGKPPIKKFKDKATGLAAMAKIETEKAARKKISAAKGDKKPSAPKEASANKLAAEFGARVGSFREKLLIAFDENYRKLVKTEDLLKAVYGSKNNENTGALTMVIKGAQTTIEKNKLAYELRKEKSEGVISYGLWPKA